MTAKQSRVHFLVPGSRWEVRQTIDVATGEPIGIDTVSGTVTIDDVNGWVIDVAARIGNGPELVDLHVRPLDDKNPPGAITADVLRAIPVGQILTSISTMLHATADSTILTPADRRRFGAYAREFAARPRPGRAGRGDEFYAMFAAEYVRLIEEGEEHPVPVMAKQRGLTDGAVRNVLAQARKRELLTPTPKGRIGGKLTDKAKRLLRDD